MDPRVRIFVAASQLDRASYYQMLSVRPGVDRATLQRAFHRFALAYHPDRYVGESDEVRQAAKRVFERGVEAYTVLRDAQAVALYNQVLSQGRLRLTPMEFENLSRQAQRKSMPAPQSPSRRPAPQSFVQQMTTPEGVEVAQRLETLIAQHRLQEAYLQVGLLETLEPANMAVKAKAKELGTMLRRRQER